MEQQNSETVHDEGAWLERQEMLDTIKYADMILILPALHVKLYRILRVSLFISKRIIYVITFIIITDVIAMSQCSILSLALRPISSSRRPV